MALASEQQIKEALGLMPQDTTKDSLIAQVSPLVEDALSAYCNRRFELNDPSAPATTRTFAREESGFTTVDDFVHDSVTNVSVLDQLGVSTALLPAAYLAQPFPGEYPVGWYIETHGSGAISPEMGFARNYDVLAREGRLYRSTLRMSVTAKWGWPAIPGGVVQAAIWTAVSFMENPRPYVSEAIQGYSRTGTPLLDAIPVRARDLLGPYVKS